MDTSQVDGMQYAVTMFQQGCETSLPASLSSGVLPYSYVLCQTSNPGSPGPEILKPK